VAPTPPYPTLRPGRRGPGAGRRRQKSASRDARRLADCNPLHRVAWVLLAAGPL